MHNDNDLDILVFFKPSVSINCSWQVSTPAKVNQAHFCWTSNLSAKKLKKKFKLVANENIMRTERLFKNYFKSREFLSEILLREFMRY